MWMRPRFTFIVFAALACALTAKGVDAEERVGESRETLCQGMSVTSVATESELRRELRRLDGGGKVTLNVTELTLEATLEIDAADICIEGATSGTVVHCPLNDKGSAIVLRARNARFSNLTFSGCRGHSAVVVTTKKANETRSNVVFDGVHFSKNGDDKTAVIGAAVRADLCEEEDCTVNSVHFTKCRFSGNRALFGGAIFAGDTDVFLEDCSFKENEARVSGGAVYISSMQQVALKTTRVNFTKNKALGDAETVGMTEIATGVFFNRTLRSAGMGGAVFAINITSLEFKDSNFTRNVACEGGGAIAVFNMQSPSSSNLSHPFTIENGVFLENEAFCGPQPEALRLHFLVTFQSPLGGALRFEASNDESLGWYIKSTSFLGNRAHKGGSVCFQSKILSSIEHTIESCVFDDNIALMGGGSIIVRSSSLTIMSSTITNGRSVFGSGIYCDGGSKLKFDENADDPSIDSVIKGNKAMVGGGIYSNDCALDMAALTLQNNAAYRAGGGIYAQETSGDIRLRGITVESNRSPVGGGTAFLFLQSVTVTANNGRQTVFRNNTSSTGGGLLFDCGDTSFFQFTVENSSFVGNRALPITDSELVSFIEEGYTFDVYPPALVDDSNFEKLLDDSTSIVDILTTAIQGHGGGIVLSLVGIRPYSIAQIVFENVAIEENEAVVGGGISSDMTGKYWNIDDRTSCDSMIVGSEICQKFEVRNLTIVKNRAKFSGGVFISYINRIVASCGPEEERTVLTPDSIAANGTDPVAGHCTNVHGNERYDGERNNANAGTRAVQLHVEGGKHHLKRVASGDPLALPCEDEQNSSCSSSLLIYVKDVFNQTIDCGIDDANLGITIVSDAIVGEHRYTAEKGIVTINNTKAWGVNQSSTLTVLCDRDHSIKVDLQLSTRECYPGEILYKNVCNECPADQYSFISSRMKCQSCEEKAECNGGAMLVPKEGYWHSTPFSPVFHKCTYFTACHYDRRRENLMRFYEDPEELARQLDKLHRYLENDKDDELEFSNYQQCSEGYEGPFCGSCQQGYGHSYTGECDPCPGQKTSSRFRFFSIAVFLFALIGINCIVTLVSTDSRVTLATHELRSATIHQTRAVTRTLLQRQRATLSCLFITSRTDFNDYAEIPDDTIDHVLAKKLIATLLLTETLKILINYLQVTGAALRLQADWSALLKSLLQVQASLVGSVTAIVSAPYECCHQDSDIPASVVASWMRLATPWMILLGLLITLVVLWTALSVWAKKKQNSEEKETFTGERLLTFAIVISIVSMHFNFIDVVREFLRTVNCVDLAEAHLDIDPAHHPYAEYAIETIDHTLWAEDTELVCFQGSHLPLGIVGVVGLVASLFFIIAIIFWLPWNKKHEEQTTFISRYWFLFQAYRRNWYTVAWEATILARKSMIAAAIVFSVHMTPTLQASICAGVLTVALSAQAIFMPFKIPDDHPNVPEYAGGLFHLLRMPSLAKRWISFNNAIDLNILEIVSLTASASIFYSAVVLHDTSSSDLGRLFTTLLAFFVNVLFLIYLLYRLYAGLHVLLDLKLDLNHSYSSKDENTMGPFALAVKAYTLFQTWRNTTKKTDAVTDAADANPEVLPYEA